MMTKEGSYQNCKFHDSQGCQVVSYTKTISYNNTGVTLYKDFLYEVVPEFSQMHAKESFYTRILCKRIFIFFYNEIRAMSMFTFVDHTIY